MRHRIAGMKLGRNTPHRRALFRNLAAAVLQHGQITTTIHKAKAVQPFVEKLITLGKRGDLHARRRAIALLQDRKLVTVDKQSGDPVYEEREDGGDKTVIQKLFGEIAPAYADRSGGYTRIIKLDRHRIGDGADLVVLQLVSEEDDGPNVSGRFSRRRQKQLGRTNYAARLRRGGKAAPEADADAEGEAGAIATAAPSDAEAPDAAGATESPEEPVESSEAPTADDDSAEEQKPGNA